MNENDPFDLFWQWVEKPIDSHLTLDADIHGAVMALPREERCDRAFVNQAVLERWRLREGRSAGTG
jgi:hypothetical protein